jgi:hypothetical protein
VIFCYIKCYCCLLIEQNGKIRFIITRVHFSILSIYFTKYKKKRWLTPPHFFLALMKRVYVNIIGQFGEPSSKDIFWCFSPPFFIQRKIKVLLISIYFYTTLWDFFFEKWKFSFYYMCIYFWILPKKYTLYSCTK